MDNYNVYKAYVKKSDGSIIHKNIDSHSSEDAEKAARVYGRVLRVVQINENGFQRFRARRSEKRGFNRAQRIAFLSTLANMMAGRNMDDALSIMIQNVGEPLKTACRKLRFMVIDQQIEPVDAFKALGHQYIPKTTAVIIGVNAKVTGLREAILEGVNYEREVSQSSLDLMVKLAFAMFWFCLAIIATILTHLYGYDLLDSFNYFALMPEEGEAVDLSNSLFNLIRISFYFASVVGSIWLFIFLFIGGGRDLFPEVVEKFILKIPILKDVMLSRHNFDACYLVERLMSKGVVQRDALSYVHEGLKNGVLKDDFERVLNMIDNGNPNWVEGFYSFGDLDRALLSSSNNIKEMSKIFGAQSDQFLARYQLNMKIFTYIHIGFMSVFMIVLSYFLFMLSFLPMLAGVAMMKNM